MRSFLEQIVRVLVLLVSPTQDEPGWWGDRQGGGVMNQVGGVMNNVVV